MTNRFKDKVDATKWLVLLLGLSVFLPAGLIAKQSMAVIFIIVIITLFFCTLLTRPSDLSPDRKVLLLFLTLCVYISFTHYLNDSCAPCVNKAIEKVLFFGLLLIYTFNVIAISGIIYLSLIPISFFHFQKLRKIHENDKIQDDDDFEDVL